MCQSDVFRVAVRFFIVLVQLRSTSQSLKLRSVALSIPSDRSTGQVDKCSLGNGELGITERPILDDDLLTATCAAQECDFEHCVQDPVAIYFPDTNAYDKYEGYDLLPDSAADWAAIRNFRYSNLQNGSHFPRLKVSDCRIPATEEKGGVVMQTVGPFQSSGGYDWMRFSWTDALRFSSLLRDFPDGVYVKSRLFSFKDEDGTLLGNPPLHPHHTHVGTGLSLRSPQYMDRLRSAPPDVKSFDNFFFYEQGHVLLEQHYETHCTEAVGGVRCASEEFSPGYGFFITSHSLKGKTLELEAANNDVRVAGSAPLKYWYHVAFRWFPKSSGLKPLHLLMVAAFPSMFWKSLPRGENAVQSFGTGAYQVLTDRQSMVWSYLKMPDVKVLGWRCHAHKVVFNETYVFLAKPEDLGLRLRDIGLYDLGMHDSVWPSIGAAKEYIFAKLNSSRSEYEAMCRSAAGMAVSGVSKIAETSANSFCQGYRPNLIMSCSNTVEQDAEGFTYGRRMPECIKRPLSIPRGADLVIVSFNDVAKDYVAPGMPSIPPTASMHNAATLWYASPDMPEESTGYPAGFPGRIMDLPDEISNLIER